MQNLNNERQIRVLFVDDDSQLVKTAKECLNQQGKYDIQFAPSAEIAFEKMKNNEYAVVVCDIQMSVTNGFEFLKQLRASGNTIPFIVFTVAEDQQTAFRAFTLGANGFVGKYGKPEVVFSTLKRCIDNVINGQHKKSKLEFLE